MAPLQRSQLLEQLEGVATDTAKLVLEKTPVEANS
jgi:hypothetical protein